MEAGEHVVVLSLAVVDGLDALKTGTAPVNKAAREASRYIEQVGLRAPRCVSLRVFSWH